MRRFGSGVRGIAASGVVLVLLSAAAIRLEGLYAINGTIENMPVERLITNLEGIVAKDPKNAALLLNLGRAHAMAYALKDQKRNVQVLTPRTGTGGSLWFEPGTKAVPFTASTTADAAEKKIAADHLTRAIELYAKGLELDASSLPTMLGYAWCLDQSGDRAKAITAYRKVVAEAWLRESRVDSSGRVVSTVSGLAGSLTAEAAGYLLPLLDPQRDSEEIETLQERIRVLPRGPRGVTPVVIPLRDGVDVTEMMNPSASVVFDADGTGIRRPWTWITPEAGWLVYAPKGAPLDSSLWLFGNVTFWMFWDNGYQALDALDDDRNGSLSGAELKDLAVWRDANSNGVADDGEVKPLAAWDIVSIDCRYKDTHDRSDYVAFSPAGVTFENGHSRPTYDVILYTKKAATE